MARPSPWPYVDLSFVTFNIPHRGHKTASDRFWRRLTPWSESSTTRRTLQVMVASGRLLLASTSMTEANETTIVILEHLIFSHRSLASFQGRSQWRSLTKVELGISRTAVQLGAFAGYVRRRDMYLTRGCEGASATASLIVPAGHADSASAFQHTWWTNILVVSNDLAIVIAKAVT
jgi:hypothetical protein